MSRSFTPTRSRAAFHHPQLAEEVLAAARTALEREGARGLSLRAVAKQAGVYPTAVSHRFGDREGLLAALAKEGFEVLNAELENAKTPKPREGVRAMLKAYLRFAESRPRLFAVMFSPWSMFERRHPELEAIGQHAFTLLRDQVAAWVEPQRKLAPDIVAESLWCTVHGLATLVIEEGAGKRKSRFDVDRILDVALRPLG
ncbi:Transcriptional regulator, TetR family [Labilithrix luteola]|uniref:Transcriptional regulator, TetR family n=1 Tax=Labilithrix luteola TaxID=1391654 RepID=A0A0K1Q8J0_9BACT|nr:TetR/AcrR family transcriptional regulator [Labilithrix luteola]AKV02063.1 Transcriptional regulator, TetR family [Labilithrix luteola]